MATPLRTVRVDAARGRTDAHRRRRVRAVLAVAALSVAGVACGSDTDENDPSDPAESPEPAGGDEPDVEVNDKFRHKLDFLAEMADWGADILKVGQSLGTGGYGYWDGDTWVVEVTGLDDRTWFDRAGNHHSAYMKVIERFTPTSDHTMRYDVRIEDEVTFTRPWEMSMTLYRRVGNDAQLQQFKCVEFVEELMYGDLRKAAD